MVTVGDLMRVCRNYFERSFVDNEYNIDSSGALTPHDGITSGQYIAIEGSHLNDGVYTIDAEGKLQNGDDELEFTEESFCGRVWLLAPPRDFIRLAAAIADFEAKNPTGGYKSESFGEYSYTKGSGKNGEAITWEQAFASDLRPYTRMFTHVGV